MVVDGRWGGAHIRDPPDPPFNLIEVGGGGFLTGQRLRAPGSRGALLSAPKKALPAALWDNSRRTFDATQVLPLFS